MKILTQGTRPPPRPPPWYMEPLTCPVCGTVFQLDSGDITNETSQAAILAHGGFCVTTARTPDGKSDVKGCCPYCHEPIMIERKP